MKRKNQNKGKKLKRKGEEFHLQRLIKGVNAPGREKMGECKIRGYREDQRNVQQESVQIFRGWGVEGRYFKRTNHLEPLAWAKGDISNNKKRRGEEKLDTRRRKK